jgi:hypothetical protein
VPLLQNNVAGGGVQPEISGYFGVFALT